VEGVDVFKTLLFNADYQLYEALKHAGVIGVAWLKVKPSVTTDEKVRVFQRKLYRRTRQAKSFKAYSLYDKICQPQVLEEAWRRVKTSK